MRLHASDRPGADRPARSRAASQAVRIDVTRCPVASPKTYASGPKSTPSAPVRRICSTACSRVDIGNRRARRVLAFSARTTSSRLDMSTSPRRSRCVRSATTCPDSRSRCPSAAPIRRPGATAPADAVAGAGGRRPGNDGLVHRPAARPYLRNRQPGMDRARPLPPRRVVGRPGLRHPSAPLMLPIVSYSPAGRHLPPAHHPADSSLRRSVADPTAPAAAGQPRRFARSWA